MPSKVMTAYTHCQQYLQKIVPMNTVDSVICRLSRHETLFLETKDVGNEFFWMQFFLTLTTN